MTRHRLGDIDGVVPGDNGAGLEQEELHEGYTRPGWAQLIMVLATGMGSAGLSSAILGSFMSSMIVVSRWFGIDPGTSLLFPFLSFPPSSSSLSQLEREAHDR